MQPLNTPLPQPFLNMQLPELPYFSHPEVAPLSMEQIHDLYIRGGLKTAAFWQLLYHRLWGWPELRGVSPKIRRIMSELAIHLLRLDEDQVDDLRSFFNLPFEELAAGFRPWFKSYVQDDDHFNRVISPKRNGSLDVWLRKLGFTGFSNTHLEKLKDREMRKLRERMCKKLRQDNQPPPSYRLLCPETFVSMVLEEKETKREEEEEEESAESLIFRAQTLLNKTFTTNLVDPYLSDPIRYKPMLEGYPMCTEECDVFYSQ